ncbi:MAG TPA: CsbD family protein [Dehalococcoidia bacterium]|nr:CsbD family protein [Dehalococcoidia bacterium]
MSARTTKVKGQAKQVKGNVKAAVGRATGNDRMKASGRADATMGKGQAAIGGAGQKVAKVARTIAGKR